MEELRKMLFYDKKNKQINVLTEFENKVPSVLYGDKTKVEKLDGSSKLMKITVNMIISATIWTVK